MFPLLALAFPAAAFACSGHAALPLERRAVNAARRSPAPTSPWANNTPLSRRAATPDRTTEEGEAQITDATQECSYYNYPPANALIPSYPEIWATADLSAPGISQEDRDLFAKINASIPDIAPRGTRAGDFSGVVYDGEEDPDCWWSWNKCTTPKLSGLQKDVVRCPEPDTWGFTLDDGPNCSHNAYFDYLQSVEQKATLFYIGSNVLDWPLEAQRGLSDGHEICSHTWSHPYMTSMSNEQAFAELLYSKKAIYDILGVTVRCWRPPYGDVDDRIRYIAQALDMRTIIWNEDTDDWEWSEIGVAAVEANYDAILAKQAKGKYKTSGAIVLSHEIDGTTMQISQQYLPKLKQAFTGGVMPVAVCMNNTTPYIETSNVYPDYAQYMAGTVSVSLASPTARSSPGTVQLDVSSSSSSSRDTTSASSAAATAVFTSGKAAGTTSSDAAATAAAASGSGTASMAAQSAAQSTTTSSGASIVSIGGAMLTAAMGMVGALMVTVVL
ncbi:hypothetical protein JCM11641_002183 [Rhodosporidiobolus odoratus]